MNRAEGIADWVERNAARDPGGSALIFLDESGAVRDRLSHRELGERVASLAARLGDQFGRGSVVLLILEPGTAFSIAFAACLSAQITCVPLPAPAPSRFDLEIPFLSRVIAETGARAILANGMVPTNLHRNLEQLGGGPDIAVWDLSEEAIATESTATSPGKVEQAETPNPPPACLLYTSGSTSRPKGVVLYERHLIINGLTCSRRWQIEPASRMVSWMPNHHSFGLIFNTILPLCSGATLIQTAPATVLAEPALWLRTIDRYRATHSAAATFGYRRAAQQIADSKIEGIDLSCWQVGLIAAEPVNRAAYSDFLNRFAGFGLRPDWFCVLYGLSETGPITSMPVHALPRFHSLEGTPSERDHACVGIPFDGSTLIVTDPQSGTPLPTGQVGEVWISGPTLMEGYFHQETENRAAFVQADPQAPRYFRTGDLGWCDSEGNLYITGRLKDVIILNGKNYYPHDIEGAAHERAAHEWADGVEASNAAGLLPIDATMAAFAIEGVNQPLVVLAIEAGREMTRADAEITARELGRAVSHKLAVRLERVVFLATGTIPKTSTGKLKRGACARALGGGEWDPMHQIDLGANVVAVQTNGEALSGYGLAMNRLIAIFSQISAIPMAELGPETGFDELALDSVHTVSLAREIERELAVACHPNLFFKFRSIGELAAFLLPESES